MNRNLSVLRDPDSGTPLVRDGDELVAAGGARYPVVRGIPRFVPSDNYARAFGDQWQRFPKTQLDSHSGVTLSATRLDRCMGGRLGAVAGKRVLEAGSGAGRFTEVLLANGAIVDTFDYSAAVEANAANNGASDRLTLVQADIRRIPFADDAYDVVVCLGVLQHTPDPEASVRSLWRKVKPGGSLVIDHYRWKVRNFLPTPLGTAGSAYRRYILSLPAEQQYATVKRIHDFWFPWVWRFRESRLAQFVLSRFSPIVCYYPAFGLRDREMYYEWMLLDTHDALTDVFKHRRSPREIRALLESLGANAIVVNTGGNGVEARCEKPIG